MATNGVVVWEWENEYGNWQPYSPQIVSFLESQLSSNHQVPLGQVDPNLYHYIVDVQNMCQIRQSTGTQRAVRRKVYPASTPIAHGITWQWEADILGRWHDFDIDVSAHLEDCLNKNILTLDLTTNFNMPYQIDLKNMTQTRIHTGRTRKIRKAFTTTSYPFDSTSGSTVSSSQNGLKRKTVINKNATLKKSKTSFPGASAAPAGLVPPSQTLPVNGLVSFPNTSVQAGVPFTTVAGSQPLQGPLTRNRYNQTISAFPMHSTTQSNTGGSILNSSPSISGTAGSQSAFGSWHNPTTLSYLSPGNMTSQTSAFGLPPPSFLSFLQTPSGPSGTQPLAFGSQPTAMGFNPTQFLSRSSRSRIRPSNPGASNIPTAPAGLGPPNFQQSPFQTASATVPSTAPFPKHARIPNNVPKGGKGGKQALSAEEILHNYVVIVGTPPASEDCCICYEKLIEASGQGTGGPHDRTVLQLEKCTHMFHKLCLDALFNSGPKDGSLTCPSCKTIYGDKMGNCPRGEMEYLILNHSLAGYEDCNTIQILYHIQPGVQGEEHPHPGKRYSTRGFPRIGYLPDNEKGRKVLQLLIIAWKRRLTFTIGMSTTTGEGDTVTWNEIHHKTEHASNYSGHGYPDPKYLDNVLLELAVHGITEKDLPP